MIRARLCGDRRGLTLIELLLTLTILAAAGALVAGALTTGLRAWQTGLRSGREELVARIVLERLATQLRAAVDSPASRDGESAVAFAVGEDYVRFVTLAAGGAPTQVFYGMVSDGGPPHLAYREYAWPDKEFFADGRPRREERVVEVTGFAVKVKRREEESDDGEAPESGEWSPVDEELPASVSVELLVGAAGLPEPNRYRIEVPVLARRAP